MQLQVKDASCLILVAVITSSVRLPHGAGGFTSICPPSCLHKLGIGLGLCDSGAFVPLADMFIWCVFGRVLVVFGGGRRWGVGDEKIQRAPISLGSSCTGIVSVAKSGPCVCYDVLCWDCSEAINLRSVASGLDLSVQHSAFSI